MLDEATSVLDAESKVSVNGVGGAGQDDDWLQDTRHSAAFPLTNLQR